MAAEINGGTLGFLLKTKADTSGVKTAQESLTGLEKQVQGIQGTLNFFKNAVVGIGAALGGLAIVKDAIESYATYQDAVTKLQQGINNVSGATSKNIQILTDQADALERTTRFSKEQTIQGQAMLTTFQLNQGTIKQLTPSMLDMAEAFRRTTGDTIDLQQVAVLFGKSMGDSKDNIDGLATALRRMGVIMTDQQKLVFKFGTEAERSATLVAIMNQNFGGFAAAGGSTFNGKMIEMQHALDDVKMAFGHVIVDALQPLLTALLPTIQGFAEFIDILTSGNIKEVNKMFSDTFGKNSAIYQFVLWFESQWPVVNNFLTTTWNIVKTNVPIVINWFKNFINTLIEFRGVFELAGVVILLIVAILNGPLLIAIGIISAAVFLFNKAWQSNFMNIREITVNVINDVIDWLNKAINGINMLIGAIDKLAHVNIGKLDLIPRVALSSGGGLTTQGASNDAILGKQALAGGGKSVLDNYLPSATIIQHNTINSQVDMQKAFRDANLSLLGG